MSQATKKAAVKNAANDERFGGSDCGSTTPFVEFDELSANCLVAILRN